MLFKVGPGGKAWNAVCNAIVVQETVRPSHAIRLILMGGIPGVLVAAPSKIPFSKGGMSTPSSGMHVESMEAYMNVPILPQGTIQPGNQVLVETKATPPYWPLLMYHQVIQQKGSCVSHTVCPQRQTWDVCSGKRWTSDEARRIDETARVMWEETKRENHHLGGGLLQIKHRHTHTHTRQVEPGRPGRDTSPLHGNWRGPLSPTGAPRWGQAPA